MQHRRPIPGSSAEWLALSDLWFLRSGFGSSGAAGTPRLPRTRVAEASRLGSGGISETRKDLSLTA